MPEISRHETGNPSFLNRKSLVFFEKKRFRRDRKSLVFKPEKSRCLTGKVSLFSLLNPHEHSLSGALKALKA